MRTPWPACLALMAATSLAVGQSPHVVSTLPARNALNITVSTDVSVTFDIDMDVSSTNDTTFLVSGMSSGPHSGVITYDAPSRTATFDLSADFAEGEILAAVLAEGITSSSGDSLVPYVWAFTAAADQAPAQFMMQTDYAAGDCPSAVFASDLDGDGDLDLALVSEALLGENVSVLKNADSGPLLSVSPSSVVFDEVPAAESACDTIRVINEGGSACAIASISGCGAEPFSLDTTMTNLELARGETTEIVVCVTPFAAGPDSCVVIMESNALNSPTTIPVRLGAVTGVPSEATPKSFRIVSVAPNPFNPTTTIHFTLPGNTAVSVEVFSVSGGRVRVLADEALLGPGDVRLTWDGITEQGLEAASGVYFIRVKTYLGSKTTRAVLLK